MFTPTIDLKTASEQDIFDFVAFRLILQGAPAFEGGTCKYRAGDKACAAGQLIPNDEYSPSLEGGSLATLINDYKLPPTLKAYIFGDGPAAILHDGSDVSRNADRRYNFLKDLQRAHDLYGATGFASGVSDGNFAPEKWFPLWRNLMRNMAARWSLNADIIAFREPQPQVKDASIPARFLDTGFSTFASLAKPAAKPIAPTTVANVLGGAPSIADVVTEFAKANVGKEFHGDDLRAFVAKRTGIAPDSARRELSYLRQRGEVQYTLISRAQSLYRIDSVK